VVSEETQNTSKEELSQGFQAHPNWQQMSLD
jgi:hypothetical protein